MHTCFPFSELATALLRRAAGSVSAPFPFFCSVVLFFLCVYACVTVSVSF